MLTGFVVFFFFFQAEDGIRDVAVTGVQTCALPISQQHRRAPGHGRADGGRGRVLQDVRDDRVATRLRSDADGDGGPGDDLAHQRDRKSTRLNSSHGYISYAVFCLKKKKNQVTSSTA